MPEPWKVTSQKIDDQWMYAVYRLRDPNGIDHSGNREYAGGYMLYKEAAEQLAEKMNALNSVDVLSTEM